MQAICRTPELSTYPTLKTPLASVQAALDRAQAELRASTQTQEQLVQSLKSELDRGLRLFTERKVDDAYAVFEKLKNGGQIQKVPQLSSRFGQEYPKVQKAWNDRQNRAKALNEQLNQSQAALDRSDLDLAETQLKALGQASDLGSFPDLKNRYDTQAGRLSEARRLAEKTRAQTEAEKKNRGEQLSREVQTAWNLYQGGDPGKSWEALQKIKTAGILASYPELQQKLDGYLRQVEPARQAAESRIQARQRMEKDLRGIQELLSGGQLDQASRALEDLAHQPELARYGDLQRALAARRVELQSARERRARGAEPRWRAAQRLLPQVPRESVSFSAGVLEEGFAAYFRGDFSAALSAMDATVRSARPHQDLPPRFHLLRGLVALSLYLGQPARDKTLMQQAEASFRAARRAIPRLDPEHVSPRIARFYESIR